MKHRAERPCVILRDTAEPHLHDREPHPVTGRCKVCGGLAHCEPVFFPRVFAPGIVKGTPYAAWPRVEVPTARANLDTGDYSLPGLEHIVSIERKSGLDLLATLFGEVTDSVGAARANQDRFREELQRGKALASFCIVTEVSVAWLYREAEARFARYGKCFDPPRVVALLRGFAVDFGVETVWAGSKGAAEIEVGSRLARVWSQATGGEDARKMRARGYSAPWLDVLVASEAGVAA